MNTYRVDRACEARTPCGMNSLLYLGDSFTKARAAYNRAETGKDTWGQANAAYGVILSVWNMNENWYTIKCRKGF